MQEKLEKVDSFWLQICITELYILFSNLFIFQAKDWSQT